jgi:excisionase family DNA binding protein
MIGEVLSMEEQKNKPQSDTPTIRKALSVRELADSLGVSFDSAYRRVKSGDVKSFLVGRRRLIPASELSRILGE